MPENSQSERTSFSGEDHAISGSNRAAPEMRGPPAVIQRAARGIMSDAGHHARAWVAASSSLFVSASFLEVCAFSAAW